MKSWRLDHRRGRRWLRTHRPLLAMHYLERALQECSVSRCRPIRRCPAHRSELSALFSSFAVALWQAGMHNRAVGSMVEASRLVKRGRARRSLMLRTNQYGMAVQRCGEVDDKQAFYGIQLARYVRSKSSHRLGTRAEIDMVAELIDESWLELKGTIKLACLSPEQKRRLFEKTLVVFPFVTVPTSMKVNDMTVDFRNGRKLRPLDRCTCGSGLPYHLCHGRTPGADELLFGKF